MTTMNNEDPADPSVHEPRVLDAAQEARLEDHAYAEGRKDEREATLAEFAALLPGPYYMDPPDGGSVTVLEQFRRMALDAQRWRAQQEWISKAIACELRCEGGGDEIGEKPTGTDKATERLKAKLEVTNAALQAAIGKTEWQARTNRELNDLVAENYRLKNAMQRTIDENAALKREAHAWWTAARDATVAERERCAQRVVLHSQYPIQTDYDRGYDKARKDAAETLRNMSTYVGTYTPDSQPKRTPLTEFERMRIIGDEFPIALVQQAVIAKVDAVCRAIERAHGIGA